MDRLIHTALNSLNNIYEVRQSTAQNLANASVPGFRAAMPNEGGSAFVLDKDGSLTARAFAVETGPARFSDATGTIQNSEVPTDIALTNEAYFIIDPGNGEYALSRRGDMKTSSEGFLVDGGKNLVMSDQMTPIEIPPFREIQITTLGEIMINPVDAEPGQFVTVGIIGTVTPIDPVIKNSDSHIRYEDEQVIIPDQSGKISQNALEGSNVNAVNELVTSMENQRAFEISMRMIKSAKEIDESGSQLLRIPRE